MRVIHSIAGITLSLFLVTPALAATWAWTNEPTPGALNLFSEDNPEEAEESFEDGALSENIILSEIMPNPEGTDTDTEWIEIYNTGTTDIDLGNWSLDDEEGGSDPYVFPANTVIEAQDFLVIYRIDSDIALNNDSDSVQLFDFEGTLLDDVTYEDNAPEGESYARILVEDQETGLLSFLISTAHAKASPSWEEASWDWTKDLTQGTTNPIYYFIDGTIQEIIPFENTVRIKTDQEEMNVSLNELNINEALKTSLFKPGNQITGYASLSSNNTYKLQRLNNNNESINPSPIASTNRLKQLSLLGLFIGFGLLGIRKLHKIKRPSKLGPL